MGAVRYPFTGSWSHRYEIPVTLGKSEFKTNVILLIAVSGLILFGDMKVQFPSQASKLNQFCLSDKSMLFKIKFQNVVQINISCM